MPEIKLIPAKGRDVPMQDGSDWPADEKGRPIAALVETSLYYRRRIKDGDLSLAPDEAPVAVETELPNGGDGDQGGGDGDGAGGKQAKKKSASGAADANTGEK